MDYKRVVFTINILLICAMVIHLGIKIFLHYQHPEYSAPIYVELITAVYYLIPLFIINIIKFVISR